MQDQGETTGSPADPRASRPSRSAVAGLIVFGSVNMDLTARVERLPRPGETVLAGEMRQLPGGKGANQAVAAARFGQQVELIAAVGNDPFGDRMTAFLAAEGIEIGRLRRVSGATGIALIGVSASGENQIIVVPGANATLACPDGVVGRAFLAQLEAPIDAVAAFLAAGRRCGALILLNAAPAIEAARPLFGLADVVIVNETELAFYCGCAPSDEPATVAEMARTIGARGWVVVTLGGKGAVAVNGGTVLHQPARRVRVADTTGAGDTFCGVVAAALAAGDTMAHALALAACAASLSVQHSGAAASMPRREAVLKALLTPPG